MSETCNIAAIAAVSQQPRTLKLAVLHNMLAALTYSVTEQIFVPDVLSRLHYFLKC